MCDVLRSTNFLFSRFFFRFNTLIHFHLILNPFAERKLHQRKIFVLQQFTRLSSKNFLNVLQIKQCLQGAKVAFVRPVLMLRQEFSIQLMLLVIGSNPDQDVMVMVMVK